MIQQMIRRLFGKKDRLSQPVHKKKQPTKRVDIETIDKRNREVNIASITLSRFI